MHRISLFFLSILLVPVSLGFGQPGAIWNPLTPGRSPEPPEVVIQEIQEGFTVHVSVSGFFSHQETVDGQTYTHLDVPQCGLIGEPGMPYMPFLKVLVPVPHGPSINVASVDLETVLSMTQTTVIPTRAPEPDCAGEPVPLTRDEQAYGEDSWFPPNPAEISETIVVRGQRFFVLDVAPLQYNPGRGEVTGHPSLDIEVRLTGDLDRQAEAVKDLRHKSFFPTMMVPQAADKAAAPRVNPTGIEYLILSDDAFLTAIEPLAAWKRLKGFTVEVVPMSIVGATTTDIQDFLQDRYDNDPDLTYVLLVGDDDQIPARQDGGHATDLYYSCLDGGDYFADVVIARISVQTATDCANVVEKILAYDRTPDQGTWHGDFLMAAMLQDNDGWDPTDCRAARWFFETGIHAMHYVRDVIGMGIYTAATSDNLSCTPYFWRTSDYPHRFAGYSGQPVPAADAALITDPTTATQNVSTAINAGVSIVQHRDHGGEDGWGDPHFSFSHIAALTNGAKTPVVYSINCLTGTFDWGAGDCFAEAFLKKYPGGCVGIVAATDLSYSGYNDLLVHGAYDCFWDDYDPADGGNIYPHSFRPAEAYLYGKYHMYNWEGATGTTETEMEIFHWFGDPEMRVITDVPATPDVVLDCPIPVGSNQLTLTCDADGAMVAVTSNGTLLGRADVSGGLATVSLDPPPDTPQTLDVVIAGTNLMPYESTCLVIVPDGPWLVHRSHVIEDSLGNGDGIVNPGEAITLPITVENVGAAAGTSLAGTLSTTSGNCSVTDPDADFPDLNVGQTGESLPDHMAITVAGTATHGETIPFVLDWTASGGYSGSTSFSTTVYEIPVISNVAVTEVTEQSALVTWTTNVPTTSLVTYGDSKPPSMNAEDTLLTTDHAVRLLGLSNCTRYYVKVSSDIPSLYSVSDDNGGAYYDFMTSSGLPVYLDATDTPIAIPDNNPTGIVSVITVDSPLNVLDVNVLLNITHTYDGDLDIHLIGPDNTIVELSTDNGASGNNFIDTLFDDEAATSITSGSAPFTGSFRPEQPLSDFDLLPAAGDWQLKIVDDAGQDVGTLDSWQLQLLLDEPCGPQTCLGDVDGDGDVDFDDLDDACCHWCGTMLEADMNENGWVELIDLVMLVNPENHHVCP